MKKYTKPMIVFESFALSTNIAGNCEIMATSQTDFHSCGFDFPGQGIVFTSDWSGCTKKVATDNGYYNGICYDVPIDANNVFNS